jgi:ankyrin repeat protein
MRFSRTKPTGPNSDLPTLPNYEALFKAEIQKDDCNVALALSYAKRKIPIYHNNSKGQTLLHIAVIQKKYNVIEELINLGFKITDEDHDFKTPSYYLVDDKSEKVEKIRDLLTDKPTINQSPTLSKRN